LNFVLQETMLKLGLIMIVAPRMVVCALVGLSTGIFPNVRACSAAELRLGIIGTDGSHSVEFTRILSQRKEVRVVAAVKEGSADLPLSASRVERFAAELRDNYKVDLVPNIAALCGHVDGILILTIDSRRHLSEVREALGCGRPIFVDKPLADNLADAREIAVLAERSHQMIWSSSPYRFSPELQPLRDHRAAMVASWGANRPEPKFALPLSYEGIHAVEILFTILGTGVTSVSRVSNAGSEVLAGRWEGGHTGIVYLLPPPAPWGAQVFAGQTVRPTRDKLSNGYDEIVSQIIHSFQTGQAPVPLSETLEILQFLDAAERSSADGGRVATILK